MAFCLQEKHMLRQLVALLAVATTMGCTDWPPPQMFQPVDLPPDRQQVDPWIARFLGGDVATARRVVDERFASDAKYLQPLVRRMAEFIPCQVHFQSGVGYVRCVRRYTDAESGATAYESLFIAEPLPADVLDSRVAFFDEPIRPVARAFLKRFAGSGEEMEGTAGQFTHSVWPSASEFNSRTDESYGEWINAKLLYASMNGDSVFIRPDGSTAWHVLETDEMIPIAETLEEFIATYADFRGGNDAFDSWGFQDYARHRTK